MNQNLHFIPVEPRITQLETDKLREKIAKDTKAFIRSGNEVTQVAQGRTGITPKVLGKYRI